MSNDSYYPSIQAFLTDAQGQFVQKQYAHPEWRSITDLINNEALPAEPQNFILTPFGFLNIYPVMIEDSGFEGFIMVLFANDPGDIIGKLLEAKMELEAIIEDVQDGIVVADATGKILRINKSFERISGIPRETMLGGNVRDGVAMGAYSESSTIKVVEKQQPVTFLNEYRYNDQIRKAVVTGRPVFDSAGNIHRVVSNIRDITEINALRDELLESQLQLNRYTKLLERFQGTKTSHGNYVFGSEKMQILLNNARKYAKVDVPLLITGESGSGKEVLTDYIHENSGRKRTPFLKINCGSIPETLLESELFGYEEGAFTGSKKGGHMGLFELAHNGTIFLDEIGEMTLPLQAKILRFAENMEFYRVGGNKLIRVDVRLISATNRDLSQMIAQKQFRLDLFHRLNVLHLTIPPLKERKSDILPLINCFLAKYNSKYNVNKKISNSLLNLFFSYDWPGNVRELQNLIERLVILSDEDCIFPEHLPAEIFVSLNGRDLNLNIETFSFPNSAAVKPVSESSFDEILERFSGYREAKEYFEKTYLLKSLQKYGTIRNTAKHIGLSHPAIIKKLSSYGINKDSMSITT
ncbi:MAG: sigma 54-interacting transcriptional regulator [Gracilibacteraceae bacterium]|jgi:PAS domain S-box-containing protein|nr:sigma 54-interacting transcriptional regulator [Gracilibacteraceae bacterium]